MVRKNTCGIKINYYLKIIPDYLFYYKIALFVNKNIYLLFERHVSDRKKFSLAFLWQKEKYEF